MEIKSSTNQTQTQIEIITPEGSASMHLSFTEKYPNLFRLILAVACAILIATFIYWKKQQDTVSNQEDKDKLKYTQIKTYENAIGDQTNSGNIIGKSVKLVEKQTNTDRTQPSITQSKINEMIIQSQKD